MPSKITNLEVAQSVKTVYDAELVRLRDLTRRGSNDAARQIIRTMAMMNLALRALGFRLNYEDSEDHELYPLTIAAPVVS